MIGIDPIYRKGGISLMLDAGKGVGPNGGSMQGDRNPGAFYVQKKKN